MKHASELHECVHEADSQYRCTVCGQTFRRWAQTQQYCTGKGYYARWGSVPPHLKSVGQWAKEDRRPKRGEVARAWVLTYQYGHGHFWADLWAEDQVVPIQRRKKKEEVR